MTSENYPENGTSAYTYDDNGNVLTKTDARGVVATATYDVLNRKGQNGDSHECLHATAAISNICNRDIRVESPFFTLIREIYTPGNFSPSIKSLLLYTV